MRGKTDSAGAAASALVALESLTNSTRPLRPTCSMRCARPGKALEPGLNFAEVNPTFQAGGDRSKRVLRIVLAAQRADALKRGDAFVLAPARLHEVGPSAK
jgi:hypothetical protein